MRIACMYTAMTASAGMSATTVRDALSGATVRPTAAAAIAMKITNAPRTHTALAGAVVQGQKNTTPAGLPCRQRLSSKHERRDEHVAPAANARHPRGSCPAAHARVVASAAQPGRSRVKKKTMRVMRWYARRSVRARAAACTGRSALMAVMLAIQSRCTFPVPCVTQNATTQKKCGSAIGSQRLWRPTVV